ncbi:dCTP deaminase/dUTPase family protein [Fundicoccus culcitae]|uniref:dUTP diphosphatase n=1 Tax=Fundicoccus culcitae TaxID=2969821 RepID=A0ABY5P376_9LACT|nr:dUTP diphosphatase [Fundicoccus culcitae]UUX33046.1 dUTP diphosphatase [Fundicoccus culcitae]
MGTQRKRGFEVITAYEEAGINLPQRATYQSAGYDIEAAETIILPSFWKKMANYFMQGMSTMNFNQEEARALVKPTLVPTGLKAYMQDDEYLQIINRSSNPLKRFLNLPNGIGIIDADYYNNNQNEGHIHVQLINFGPFDQTIQKGDRIAQGIFASFLKTDQDKGGLEERQGGFGSSD